MLRVIAELGEPWRSAPSRQDFNELPARGAGVTAVELKSESSECLLSRRVSEVESSDYWLSSSVLQCYDSPVWKRGEL